jgi:hypothetical protein
VHVYKIEHGSAQIECSTNVLTWRGSKLDSRARESRLINTHDRINACFLKLPEMSYIDVQLLRTMHICNGGFLINLDEYVTSPNLTILLFISYSEPQTFVPD